MEAKFSFKCTFKSCSDKKLFEYCNTATDDSVLWQDIEHRISKCVFHSISDLIDECWLVECGEQGDIEIELIRHLKRCTECQKPHRGFIKKYFLPLGRDSREEPIFQTKIKFSHRQIKFRTTIAWALIKCPDG